MVLVTLTIEEREDGIQKTAQITGQISGEVLTLEKRSEYLWVLNKDNTTTPLKDADVPLIFYQGQINENRLSISGSWRSDEFYRPINDEMFKFPEIGGTWEVFAKS